MGNCSDKGINFHVVEGRVDRLNGFRDGGNNV